MGVPSWSLSAAPNAVADPLIRAADSAAARTFPASVRALMAGARAQADDRGGAITTGGVANAYTAATASGIAELRPGLSLLVRIDRDNTDEPTLNVDGTGPKPWRDQGGTAIVAGLLVKGMFRLVVWDDVLKAWISELRSPITLAYDSVASLTVSSVANNVGALRVNGFAAAGDGGAALYRRVLAEPAHAGKFRTADGAWWEIAEDILHMRMFGARGDYDPGTRTGTNDTLAIRAALATAATLDRELQMGRGTYYHLGELKYPSGLNLKGKRRARSILYVDVGSKETGTRLEASSVNIEDVGTMVYNRAALGADDGEYGAGVTISRYYTNGEPFDTRKLVLKRVGYYAAPGTPFLPAHGLNGVGRFAEIDADDIEVVGFGGAAVHFHWGADALGIEMPITASYHPNKISVSNVVANGCGRIFTLSSGYDIRLTRLRGINCRRLGEIIPGDEADAYASVADKGLVGSSIHISDFLATGLFAQGTVGSLRIFSIGTSRADKDPATGLGQRKVLPWKQVIVERGKMVGADDVERAIDLTSAVGNIVVRNVDITGVARLRTGIRAADCRGNILIDGVQSKSAQPIEISRARGIRWRNMDCTLDSRSGLTEDAVAIKSAGTDYTVTLASALAVGATSITLSGGFGGAGICYPGDEIKIAGKSVIVAGSNSVRSSDTVIPIRPATFAADTGASVYLDLFSDVDVVGTFTLYDVGASLAGCRRVDLVGCDFVDIGKIGVSGAARGGKVSSRFIRGGQHRLIDAAYQPRNIVASAGCENIWYEDNDFGVSAEHFGTLFQTSSDTGNLRIRNNAFGNASGPHMQVATQTDARLDAGQFNEILGNYRRDGGALTGPGTWYEIGQNGIVRYHGPAAPTRGFHRAGSEWVNTAPAIGAPTGGMCTTSGAPGSWNNKANL